MRIAIGLGSNLGEPLKNIHSAVAELKHAGVENLQLSGLFETVPVDCVPGTPDFINAAVVGEWANSLEQLLATCKTIEEKLGRPREHSSAESRVIDLDIVLAEDKIISSPQLNIPHPQIRQRLFVLLPLCDIIPDWIIPPGTRTVAEITRELKHSLPGDTPVWRVS